MKLSYNQACTLHNSVLARDIVLCEQAGYDYIELHISKLYEYLATHSLEELRDFFKRHRLKPYAIDGIYVYADFLGENDDVGRGRKLMEDFVFACRVGQMIGARSLTVVPDLNRDEEENKEYDLPWDKVVSNTVRIFRKLSDVAAGYQMNIGLEIVGSRRCSIRTMEQAATVIDAVNRSNAGYTLDAFNLFLYGGLNDFSGIKRLDPGKIFIVHINNSENIPAARLRQANRTFCDRGIIDLGNYLHSLGAAGYDGPVSIEFFRPDCWVRPADWVIRKTFDTTRQVLEKYGFH